MIQEIANRFFDNNRDKSLSSFIGVLGLCGYSIKEIHSWLRAHMSINITEKSIEKEIELESIMWYK